MRAASPEAASNVVAVVAAAAVAAAGASAAVVLASEAVVGNVDAADFFVDVSLAETQTYIFVKAHLEGTMENRWDLLEWQLLLAKMSWNYLK